MRRNYAQNRIDFYFNIVEILHGDQLYNWTDEGLG